MKNSSTNGLVLIWKSPYNIRYIRGLPGRMRKRSLTGWTIKLKLGKLEVLLRHDVTTIIIVIIAIELTYLNF